jgi:hypothetical protein
VRQKVPPKRVKTMHRLQTLAIWPMFPKGDALL